MEIPLFRDPIYLWGFLAVFGVFAIFWIGRLIRDEARGDREPSE